MGRATTVFLVRHGIHDLVGHALAGRMAGVSLNGAGRVQAVRAAARLSREPIAALYASPLERTRETMEPIARALSLPVALAPEIVEIDYGDWTGATLASVADDPRWQDWNRNRAASRIPGGETMEEVRARGAGALETWRLAHPGSAVAATSHGDVIRAVVCGVIGLSFDRVHEIDVDPGSITTLVVWEGGGKLVTLNEIPA